MSIRALRPLARAAFAAPQAAVVRAGVPVARQVSGTNARTFSVSSRWMGNGESDGALVAAIQAEQQFEIEEAANQPEEPEFLTHFKSQGVWDLKTLPGAEDVILTRKFGNEQLELTFQVSEVDPVPVVEGAEAEAEVEEAESTPPIVTASLVVSKHGHPNAMSIDLDAGEDGLVISNVAMFERSVAVQKGSEGDWARRERYLGPQFEHLDAGVQEQFSAYLAERGVDDGLAQFILSYAEHKEQTDYVQWLEQVKGFLDA